MSTHSASPEMNIALYHPDERQRMMLSSALGGAGFQVHTDPLWDRLCTQELPLGGVWVLFDESGYTQHRVKQVRSSRQQAFWGILILGQAHASDQYPIIHAGADAYLSYPFDLPALNQQITQISSQRATVTSFNILPPQMAAGLDRVWARFDDLSYYELLELNPLSGSEEVQERFHQRSLMLHPDRHRGLKMSHPPVYQRINLIYKRLLEGYRVLTHDLQRPVYDAALIRGEKRWGYRLDEQVKSIQSTTESIDHQIMLARASSMRSRGLLKVAYQFILEICQREPQNQLLARMASGYEKLIELASRDAEIAELLEDQIAPEVSS